MRESSKMETSPIPSAKVSAIVKSTLKSILITELSEDLINRDTLTQYFERFGPIERINCSLKHKYAIVHYTNVESAQQAKLEGSKGDPRFESVKIQFSGKSPVSGLPSVRKPLRTPKSPISSQIRTFKTRKLSSTSDREVTGRAYPVYRVSPRSTTSEVATGSSNSSKAKHSAPIQTVARSAIAEWTPIAGTSEFKSHAASHQSPMRLSRSTASVEQFAHPSMKKATSNPFLTGGAANFANALVKAQIQKQPNSTTSHFTNTMKPVLSSSTSPINPVFPVSVGSSVEPVLIVSGSAMKPVLPSFGSDIKPLLPASAFPMKNVNLEENKERKSGAENLTYDLLTFKPDTSESQELFSKRYVSAEERYRVLESRDKILRARIPKVKVRVELATKLFGTCLDMCPEKERYMRQFQRQLTIFESLNTAESVVDDRKAVKAYSRSSADQEEPLPHDLRPGSTLEMTMDFLLHNIVPIAEKEEDILADWYNFLWDRTRSIRKDITQQQLTDLQAVGLMEKCARFHIYCSSRLCELDLHSFEPKLNDENLMKCLQSLEHLYDDLRRRGIKCVNEPEFRAYQIMMNLNEGDILWDVQQRPEWVLKSPEVQLALKIHHIVFNKNFVAFFRVVKSSPYMVSCILHRYFFQVRSGALRSLWKSHSCPPKIEVQVSFSAVQRMLGYGDSVAVFQNMCQSHGIICDIINDRLVMNRKKFNMPQSRVVSREYRLIESKLHISVAEAINGAPLGPNPSATYKAHSSFNEEGYLVPGPVAGIDTSIASTDSLTVPGQSKSLLSTAPTSPQNIDLFEGSSSFASVANQNKSSLSGFYKSSFQTKGGFGRSVSPQPVFQFQESQEPLRTANLPSSIFARKEKASPIPMSANQLPIVPSAEEIKIKQETVLQDALSHAYDKVVKKMSEKEIETELKLKYELEEKLHKERMEREEKDKLRLRLCYEAVDKVGNIAIQNILAEILEEKLNKSRCINQVCVEYEENIRNAFVDYVLPKVMQEVLSEMAIERQAHCEKARAIFKRLKIRRVIQKWKAYVKTRKHRAEKQAQDRLDFPCVNTHFKSSEDVLSSLRRSGRRSINTDKGGKTTSQWLALFEKANAVKKELQHRLQYVAFELGMVEHPPVRVVPKLDRVLQSSPNSYLGHSSRNFSPECPPASFLKRPSSSFSPETSPMLKRKISKLSFPEGVNE